MIKYVGGKYCWRITQDIIIKTNVVGYMVYNDYYSLQYDGTLILKNGYQWNGINFVPSFLERNNPEIKKMLLASAYHDAFYQMLQNKDIPKNKRVLADYVLYNNWILNNVNKYIAKLGLLLVRAFGKYFI